MDIISPILNVVSCLYTSTGANMCYLCGLKENQDALKDAIEELKDTRDDVKRRVDEAERDPNQLMKRTHEVSGWLQRVQAIEGEVGEIFKKTDQEIEGRCMKGYCVKNCWKSRKIGKLVIRKLVIVNDLRSKGSFGDVAYRLPPPLVQREPVDLTVGMESMFEKVLRWLDDDEIRIMGLYGCGGVGKTTLLKQINNVFSKTTTSSSSTHGFDVVILVVVSKVINIDAIQKEIGKRLGLSSTEADKTSIFNALSEKSFMLLLDDIWERVDLQRIGVPSPSENRKSKLIFTTRSETVCELMKANEMLKVQYLPWDKAWSLFQEEVGERALNSHPKVPELAKIVAKECGGLPLALITIGRAMSSKKTIQEWNHAITTLQKYASEFPGMGEEVLPLLKLSYDNLRDDKIKSCFLYCALFPEDHFINKAKLIDYWIGEGVILLNEFDHIDEARNQGYDVIGILKGACLLESDGQREETQVRMHDTIRDLALWIAHECGSKRDKVCIIETSDLTAERSWYNAERIYLIPPPPPPPPPPHNSETEEVRSPPSPLKSPNLITLIHHRSVLPQNFFEFMPLLRVLDLTYSRMKTFPTSITELLELRYLNLSRTEIKELPMELRKLVKLNYLDLSYMMGLSTIPSGVIGSLLELRVLNLHGCPRADWDIEEVYKLKHLNDLGIYIYTEDGTLTKLLSSSNKNLQMCTRRLILVSEDKPQVPFRPFVYKYVKPKPDPFWFQPQSTTSSSSPIITLEKLQLFFNLELLVLDSFPEAELMNMGIEQHHHQLGSSSCFQNLSKIEISNCNALKDLTWIGYVPNLKTLNVSYCKELEEIVVIVVDDSGGDEMISSKKTMNNVEAIFKSLKTLHLGSLPKLKSICRNALAFPCLKSMGVLKCPQLKKLPFDSASNVNNTLRRIKGGRKWWSELQWEEGEQDHNNSNNSELLKSKFLLYFVEDSFYDDESDIVEENETKNILFVCVLCVFVCFMLDRYPFLFSIA